MPRRYQVTLQGTGFLSPVEGDKPARGFFTLRRVQADGPEDARQKAIRALEQETRYRGLVETTIREGGRADDCRLQPESVEKLSWFRWHFSRTSTSLIFFQGDEKEG